MSRGLPLKSAVLVSPPSDLVGYSRQFARWTWMPEALRRAMQAAIEERYGLRWFEIEIPRLAPRLKTPALVIHDHQDSFVPWAAGRARSRAPGPARGCSAPWASATAASCENEAVVRAAADFIAGNRRREPRRARAAASGAAVLTVLASDHGGGLRFPRACCISTGPARRRRGTAQRSPQVDGKPAFKPTRAATVAVGLVLLATSAIVLLQVQLLIAGAAAVLVLRAIGDFRLVGFFKRVRGSRFARLDTLLYSPLCLALGTALALLAAG